MCLREKIGPDPRNFNQRVSLGRNDLLIRTFPKLKSEGEFILGPVAYSATRDNKRTKLAYGLLYSGVFSSFGSQNTITRSL